ncbi:BMP family ABC transporter substrate-binding protein [Georgenia sp. 10Sc9-8]|uniref:BMP family ABC transporter substrate-binding protein n=1 Tax=Georgenia halotolerans TaxID=3028317 RepID=A0ABT5TZ36_9MICO|nr:BMP family ABC transporter substrate-binding protein [Georgenia halotolerans]
MKKSIYATALAATAALTLAACGDAPEDEPAGTDDTATSEETDGGDDAAAEEVDYQACLVSDAGGWDDQSFNQSAYEGLTQAEEELGIQTSEAESQSDSDFGPNVDAMVQQGCDLTIGVGFLLEDPIQDAAESNPDLSFALVDSTFADADGNPVELDNAKPIIFNTAEASYLAGYVAAGMSETGTVATFGGLPIPSVSIFMDGFVDGVAKYNEDNDADVQVLGWDKEAQDGAFSGGFEDQGQGQQLTEQFIAQGADIVMPVAGPVGLGAAAAAEEAGDVWIIGVDSDWYESTEYGDLVLTSVVKEIGAGVQDTIEQGVNGEFTSEPYVGDLENGGVSLAPFHDFEDQVPQELKDAVTELEEQIASGELEVETPNAP